MKKMKKVVKRWWLEALRSGEYARGEGELVAHDTCEGRDEYRFCCLGVLENIYHEKNGTEFPENMFFAGWHSDPVATWSGLSNNECAKEKDCVKVKTNFDDFGWYGEDKLNSHHYIAPHEYLAQMNDEGKSFKRIAQWIEKNL